jgi:two-component system sensor histidine kinase UhpB
LRPTVLDLGLKNALQALTDRITASGDVRVALQVTGSDRKLDPEVELAVYRIAQESLSNVIQHSGAENVKVRFCSQDHIELEIADDGDGFDPDRPTVRYGIVGMRERAMLAGGTLNIYSEPRKGTTVRLEIP